MKKDSGVRKIVRKKILEPKIREKKIFWSALNPWEKILEPKILDTGNSIAKIFWSKIILERKVRGKKFWSQKLVRLK